MYFHKPADALVPDSQGGDNSVALAMAPGLPPGAGVPDVSPPVAGTMPPPARPAISDQPIPAVPPIPVLPPAGVPAITVPVPTTEFPQRVLPSMGVPAATLPVPAYETPRVAPPSNLTGRQVAAQSGPGKSPTPPTPPVVQNTPRLPPRAKIFLIYDDKTLEEAIKAVVREDIERGNAAAKGQPMLPFPDLPKLVPDGTNYVAKTGNYEPLKAVYEPGFVVYRRLHFEDPNAERYGWDLGIIQPFVSSAYFFRDVVLWPQSLASSVVNGMWDTNAGRCLPGSPVPYNFYPPGLTLTGSVWEATVVTGLAFLIP